MKAWLKRVLYRFFEGQPDWRRDDGIAGLSDDATCHGVDGAQIPRPKTPVFGQPTGTGAGTGKGSPIQLTQGAPP
jgi:hypothetical protein